MEPFADLPRAVTLKDGSRALVRPLVPEDEPYLREAFEMLSQRSRELRFLSPGVRPAESEFRYLVHPDGVTHLAVAMERYPIVADDRVGIGVARCVRLPERPDTAEVALVVADEMQGLGAGKELVAALRDGALAIGIRRFWGLVRVDNDAVVAVLSSVGKMVAKKIYEPGVYEGVWELEPSTR